MLTVESPLASAVAKGPPARGSSPQILAQPRATNPRCPASGVPGVPTRSRARRLPWADLLRRMFAEDVLHCPCGAHRSVTAFVVDERLARSLLTTLGLAAEIAPSSRHVPHPR